MMFFENVQLYFWIKEENLNIILYFKALKSHRFNIKKLNTIV